MVIQCCCVICTELFVLKEDHISALPCGHIFHHHCITEWFNTKVNCPECRKQTKRNSLIQKLFLNVEEVCDKEHDPATLKNALDTAKCQLRVKESEKLDLVKANESLLTKIGQLKDKVDAAQQQCQEERSANQTLARELKFHKKLQLEAEEAKKETSRVRKKLEDLKSLEVVVRGNQDEIEEKISTSDKSQLATYAVILQKELMGKRKEVKALRQETMDLKKTLSMKKKLLAEKNSELEVLKEKSQHFEQDYSELETKNDKLKDKISKLEKALGSPSDSAVAFAKRLIHESPAPLPLAKRPKLSLASPEDNQSLDTSIDLFTSPELAKRSKVPSGSGSDSSQDVGLPVTYLNMSQASSRSQTVSKPKSGMQDISNVPNVSGLGSFNLFKKKTGSGLMDSGSGRIRMGYNGLGGHEKHVQSSGFAKPASTVGGKKRSGSVFGKSKIGSSLKAPPLPTLDNFMS